MSSIDDIIALYKKDIDVSLIAENLKLTVEERLRKLERMQEMLEELRKGNPERPERRDETDERP